MFDLERSKVVVRASKEFDKAYYLVRGQWVQATELTIVVRIAGAPSMQAGHLNQPSTIPYELPLRGRRLIHLNFQTSYGFQSGEIPVLDMVHTIKMPDPPIVKAGQTVLLQSSCQPPT